MSTLVLEPVGGIAGDMVIAALLHLGAPRAALDEGLRRLGLSGVSVEAREVEVAGIRALHGLPQSRDQSELQVCCRIGTVHLSAALPVVADLKARWMRKNQAVRWTI